jgi:hypothetical protein
MPGVSRRLLTTVCALAIAGSVYGYSPAARADSTPRLSIDWGNTLAKGMTWLESKSERSRVIEGQPRAPEVGVGTGSPELGSAWFGVAPKVSLVARDWGTARSLAGGPLAVTDAIRVSRSSRLVMSRIRLGEGRISPFTQLGLGQWRVDTEIVPHLPRNVELAALFGAGVEMRLFRGWELAAEADLTVLYREVHEPQQLTTPRMWGAFLASRVEF